MTSSPSSSAAADGGGRCGWSACGGGCLTRPMAVTSVVRSPRALFLLPSSRAAAMTLVL